MLTGFKPPKTRGDNYGFSSSTNEVNHFRFPQTKNDTLSSMLRTPTGITVRINSSNFRDLSVRLSMPRRFDEVKLNQLFAPTGRPTLARGGVSEANGTPGKGDLPIRCVGAPTGRPNRVAPLGLRHTTRFPRLTRGSFASLSHPWLMSVAPLGQKSREFLDFPVGAKPLVLVDPYLTLHGLDGLYLNNHGANELPLFPRRIHRVFVRFDLPADHFEVRALLVHQFVVRAAFDDLAVFHEQDQVGAADR